MAGQNPSVKSPSMQPQYLPVGLKDAIKLDITYKAIDLTNAAAELRTRIFSRRDATKEYEGFYLVFASLFYVSFPYIEKYILGQSDLNKMKVWAKEKTLALHGIFYMAKSPKSKNAMLMLSRDYLSILRMSNLTEIGGQVQPFDERLFTERR